jgi:cytoskeleton protein RodZ
MDEIGSTLREARMRERIDISEVEATTKIRAKYLRAIENEEWDLLPGTVYAKSFLRTYGDFLGLDSRMLLDEFKRRYERPDHDARPIGTIAARERERERGRRGPRFPSWSPIAAVVVAIVVVLFIVGSLPSSNTSSTTSTQQAHHHPRHRTATARKTKTAAVHRAATLQLVPTGPVYVCLVNGAGRKLINEQTFNPGQAIPTERASKLLLTLGNASVQMKVNGKAVPVTPSSTAIRLMITPHAVSHIPNSQIPTCP